MLYFLGRTLVRDAQPDGRADAPVQAFNLADVYAARRSP